MKETILVINSGSSSIKFSIFTCSTLELLYHGEIKNILEKPQLNVFDEYHHLLFKQSISLQKQKSPLNYLFDWLEHLKNQLKLIAVGHRVVHGGSYFSGPTLITEEVIQKMASLNSLAPLHQALNIEPIKIICKHYPQLIQVACFDMTFHHTQDKLAQLFAIPRALTSEGIIRYGFHGISYEYIASVLPKYLEKKANDKIIVAHLGQGASMCAMKNRKSVSTTMGFTALDGLMMGTRCGTIDPGVILYLLREKKMSVKKVNALLYQESGLLGVSGISSNMHELLSSTEPHAAEAVELFCSRAASQLSALCATLQGCDAIIFTAGIGENSAIIRKKICNQLQWLGVFIDEDSNEKNASIISKLNSRVLVAVIPTNEELIIAKHTQHCIIKV